MALRTHLLLSKYEDCRAWNYSSGFAVQPGVDLDRC